MNEKQSIIYDVLDIVVEETTTNIGEFTTISRDDILGKSKNENSRMSRCLFVTQLKFLGYSNATIAAVISRQEKTVNEILCAAHEYKKVSWAYRIAEAKITLKVRDIMSRY